MGSNTMAYIIRQVKSSSIIKINPYSVDKNDLKDVQLQNKDIMCDIASSVKINLPLDYDWKYEELEKRYMELLIQKVYEFKRFLDRLNDHDAITVPHEDAQATLGDTNDPFTSISMSKDFTNKYIAAIDAY
ncbi:hypothetical protein Tco_0491168 [Tanacetum coccineum]